MMKTLRAGAVVLLVVSVMGLWGPGGGARAQEPTPGATPTVVATPDIPAIAPYFSLGDSLADAEGASSHEAGYVALFAAQAWPILGFPGTPADRGEFGLRGGETTTTMLAPGGQLDRAIAEIGARNSDGDPANNVRLITVDIGGNDFRVLTRSESPCRVSVTSADCQQAVAGVISAFTTNYPLILERVRAAAGADTIIIAMAFYNPFSGTGQSVDAPGDFVAEQITAQARAVALSPGVRAVWVDMFALFRGKAPELTHILADPPNIHPNDAGYAAISDALAGALRGAIATPTPEPPSPPAVGNSPARGGTPHLWLWVAVVLLVTAGTASGGWAATARPGGRG